MNPAVSIHLTCTATESLAMPIKTTVTTTVYCDGNSGVGCGSEASITFPTLQGPALASARRLGWKVAAEALCPACAQAEVKQTRETPRLIGMLQSVHLEVA